MDEQDQNKHFNGRLEEHKLGIIDIFAFTIAALSYVVPIVLIVVAVLALFFVFLNFIL